MIERQVTMSRRMNDQSGMAMITAILVSFVVLILGIAALNISIHNSVQSGKDRDRAQALQAAEAGIDYYFSYLQSTGGGSPSCTVTQTVIGSPTASFTVTPTFYASIDGTGSALSCPAGGVLASGVTPGSVLIRSVGLSSSAYPKRTMEALAKLTVTSGSTFDNSQAIFGNSSVTFSSNNQVGGAQYNDADVYTNGSYSISSNSVLYGNVYSQGSVSLGSNSDVKKDVWANTGITMGGNARIRGNGTSSTSSITMTSNSHIYGNAKAATTIATGIVDGYRTPNTPSGAPPTRSYPSWTYNGADWTGASPAYTVHPYADCTTLFNAGGIGTWWGGADGTYHVVRVTGNCTVNSSVTVKGNLAFIVDGNMTLGNGARFSPGTGTAAGPWNLYFFVGLSGAGGCQYQAQPHSGMDSGLSTIIYTRSACTVDIQSNSALTQGQIYGGTVNIKNSMSFQFARVPVPATGAGGFKEDVFYIREVV
jgi:Tfp pilus assembly protein PilX